jgi:hypothetical protein
MYVSGGLGNPRTMRYFFVNYSYYSICARANQQYCRLCPVTEKAYHSQKAHTRNPQGVVSTGVSVGDLWPLLRTLSESLLPWFFFHELDEEVVEKVLTYLVLALA